MVGRKDLFKIVREKNTKKQNKVSAKNFIDKEKMKFRQLCSILE